MKNPGNNKNAHCLLRANNPIVIPNPKKVIILNSKLFFSVLRNKYNKILIKNKM